MFIFIHFIAGLLIGLSFKSKVLVIILALVSHFLLDMVPHWDGDFDKKYFELTGKVHITKKDVILHIMDFFMVIIGIFIFWHYTKIFNINFTKTTVTLGIFMSLLPDLLKFGYVTKLKNKKSFRNYLKFHSNIQKKHWWLDWKVGLVIQALFLIALLLSLIWIMFF